MADLTESVHIEASAARVYSLISDLSRMGEWSPECTSVRWHGDVTQPMVGARFTGHNRNGWQRWSTTGTVVRATTDRMFAFEINVGPVPAALWAYLVTPDDDGCTATEEWTDRRPTVLRAFMDRAFGRRHDLNRAGIRETLANLKAAAETPPLE